MTSTPQVPLSVARSFTPCVGRNQAARGGGRENVVIELEAREAEKSDDDEDPEPEKRFRARERNTRANATDRIDATAGDHGTPRKERTGERAQVERVIDRPG